MRCALCKDEMQEGYTTHSVDIGKSIVIIKKVPAFMCPQCGEVWYSGAVQKQIEQIVESIKNSFAPEIAVLSYPDSVAA
jgi:YgiT-type zinc finger domain-containing protein